MKRWLYAHRLVTGDPARLDATLREQIADLLTSVTERAEPGVGVDGSVLVRLPGRAAGIETAKNVRIRTGVAGRHDRRTRIPVTWEAAPGRALFPEFDGAFEIEALDRHVSQLALIGSYTVPMGPIGAVADAAGLGTVAQRTVEDLVAALARALEEASWATGADVVVGQVVTPATRWRVGDVMTREPVILHEDMPVRTAALVLFHHDISGAPVVDDAGELVGVLSEADVIEKESFPARGLGRKAVESDRRRNAVTVGEACSRPARTTVPDAPLRAVAREMLDQDVARLVVVGESRVAGMVTRHDVLRALLRADAELQAAVDEVLGGLAEAGVRGSVAWGVVHLEGAARLRSRVPYVVRTLREIDGIVDVTGDLDWQEDDVAYPAAAMPGL